MCRSSSREKHIFTSNGNIVNVQIITQSSMEETNGFLLEYKGEYKIRDPGIDCTKECANHVSYMLMIS